MKNLFIKIFLFSLMIFIIGIALSLFLPRNTYWGNKVYAWKINEYKKGKYNAVFYGTSRINRGINPLVFDSMVNQKFNTSIKSFNLATDGTWASETFYLYDAFLNDPSLSSHVNLVFMEFQNIMSIRPDKLGSDKTVYYQNPRHYLFQWRYNFHEVLRNPKKILTSIYSIGVYSLSTFLNVTNVKKINVKKEITEPIEFDNINSRGHLGFKSLIKVHVTDETMRSYTDNIRQYLHEGNQDYNPAYHEKIIEVIEKSRQRGIKLIFILPPVRLTDGMMAVYHALPPENKIEVCDPEKYPELYNQDNWIDPVHLNKIGSTYLTAYFIDELKKTLNQKIIPGR